MKKKKKQIRSLVRRDGKLRPKDEKFCRAVAAGSSGSQAYREHVSLGNCNNQTAQTAAYHLLQKPMIRERIEQLKERDKRTIEERLAFSRETLARFYMEALETPVGEVDQNHRLCQEYTVTEGERSTTTKIKMVGKLEAGKALAQMAGWIGNGNDGGKAPQVTINLGAVFSPSPDSPKLTAVRIVEEEDVKRLGA